MPVRVWRSLPNQARSQKEGWDDTDDREKEVEPNT
jgi:hypothetical protein